jgi:hypothetical protein
MGRAVGVGSDPRRRRPARARWGGRFTPAERGLATQRVEELRRYLLETAARSDGDREAINRKLDYLVAATERLERFDWRQVAASVVIQLAFDLAAKGPLLPLVAAAWGILSGAGHSGSGLIP